MKPSLVVGPCAEEDVRACCGHSLGASDVRRPAFSVQLRPCMAACVQCPEVTQHRALLGCPRKHVEPVTHCSQGVQAPAQHARGHLGRTRGVSCLFIPQIAIAGPGQPCVPSAQGGAYGPAESRRQQSEEVFYSESTGDSTEPALPAEPQGSPSCRSREVPSDSGLPPVGGSCSSQTATQSRCSMHSL